MNTKQPIRRYHPDGELPDEGEIFVFGSNEAGRHGAGAALVARRCFGALYGVGRGLMGQCYAIPTKNRRLISRLLSDIHRDIRDFVHFTIDRPDLSFFVTAVGCGYAGFKAHEIAPLFRLAVNCSFPGEWKRYLEEADEQENNRGDEIGNAEKTDGCDPAS